MAKQEHIINIQTLLKSHFKKTYGEPVKMGNSPHSWVLSISAEEQAELHGKAGITTTNDFLILSDKYATRQYSKTDKSRIIPILI